MTTTLLSSPIHEVSVPPHQSGVRGLSDSDRKSAAKLLRQFGVIALGEGDLAAGANTLAVMALTLANTAPPRSCISDQKSGPKIRS